MKKSAELMKIKGFEEEIPFFLKGDQTLDNFILFIPGLGGSGSSFIKTIDTEELFKNFCIISLDMRGQGKNKNKPSKFRQRYVNDLKLVINFIIKKFKIKNLYLLGESWGSALIILYLKQNNNPVIKGVIGWNMPYSIMKNEEKNKQKSKFIDNMKVAFTYFTNITTHSKRVFKKELTNNEIILRINGNGAILQNNKLPIATWKSLKIAWRYLKSKKRNNKCWYIQSLGDVLRNDKAINKYKEHIIVMNKGTHLLSLDVLSSQELFKIIKKTIQ